jgi:hypothetical protein
MCLIWLVALTGLASTASATSGGNFVATGHDIDYHCSRGNTDECAYLKIVVDKVRNGSTLPILALDQGTQVSSALTSAGYAGVVTVDPSDATALAATHFVNADGTPAYSAIITASDSTCGGCDNTSAGESNINARSTDFATYFNAGGGILALAGGDNFSTYYSFVPVSVAATVVAPPFNVTPSGSGLGLTGTMVNCCETHNSFSQPPAPFVVLENDNSGNAETIAAFNATIGGGGFNAGPSRPVVVVLPPLVSGSSGSVFSGSVNPEGLPTTAHFEYGLDPRYSPSGGAVVYDQSTPVQAVGSDSVPHSVRATVTGLVPNALYHVRLVADSGAGRTLGPDQAFTTAADPPPPPPVLGKAVNVVPVSGLVFVKPPPGKSLGPVADVARRGFVKGHGFVPLTEARQLPSGSQIDARAGSLQMVTAAATRTGKLQTGVFGGALFSASQARAGLDKGLTTLHLLEGVFAGAPSYSSCPRAASEPGAAAAKVSSRVLQTLHASDRGRFRTRGHFSYGTPRGTTWDTIDRCDGTLTVVHRGTVAVFDFGRRKTIIVHAGHSYLASATRLRKK